MFFTKKHKQRIKELEREIDKIYEKLIDIKYEFVFDKLEPKYCPTTNTSDIDFIIKEKTIDGYVEMRCNYKIDFLELRKMKATGEDIQSRIKHGIKNTTLDNSIRQGFISGSVKE
jgi:SPX domain protein involved in polyphosphate accumulation